MPKIVGFLTSRGAYCYYLFCHLYGDGVDSLYSVNSVYCIILNIMEFVVNGVLKVLLLQVG